MHSTDDLEDGYLGSGTFLWHSIRKHLGEKNGSFGSKWIYSDKLKESKRCKGKELEDLLKINNWKLGRKIKF